MKSLREIRVNGNRLSVKQERMFLMFICPGSPCEMFRGHNKSYSGRGGSHAHAFGAGAAFLGAAFLAAFFAGARLAVYLGARFLVTFLTTFLGARLVVGALFAATLAIDETRLVICKKKGPVTKSIIHQSQRPWDLMTCGWLRVGLGAKGPAHHPMRPSGRLRLANH